MNLIIDRALDNFLYATTRQLLVSQDNMGACYVLMGRDVIKKAGWLIYSCIVVANIVYYGYSRWLLATLLTFSFQEPICARHWTIGIGGNGWLARGPWGYFLVNMV